MAAKLSRRSALGTLLLGDAADPATATILIRGAYVIDGTRQTLMPRLTDAH
ncbi:hypothetical protein RZN05_13110 [Sphingomonas sp. HF-S4]|uniref:Amidohydrolase n=1 Tax=Sphingomonas agrestis TaxID=3080540 RepID=A0ABU3Y9U0_9SPHN|nr:hypothetical protein [Sphingomonas sp. HF-S4]MDV3457928.1 hypothetical protein [Sphingomonas sp. HF-S4]